MSFNKNTPGANGGAVRNVAKQFYPSPKPPAIVDWLNPRRRSHCERLVQVIVLLGGKVYLPDHYHRISARTGLDRYQVDRAVDDSFALGLVDVREAGAGWCVEVLSVDLEWATSPNGGGR